VWAYTLIVVTSVTFWFSSLADCSRAAFQYQGLPVTEVGLGSRAYVCYEGGYCGFTVVLSCFAMYSGLGMLPV
jgi:hypothetical protein